MPPGSAVTTSVTAHRLAAKAPHHESSVPKQAATAGLPTAAGDHESSVPTQAAMAVAKSLASTGRLPASLTRGSTTDALKGMATS